MILFNRDGDGGIEITKALGLISDRVDFSTWAPILPLGLRDVIAIIGREPVEALAEYYEAGDDNDERKSRALAYLQQSVALFSWLKIIPTLDAMHDNTGRAKRIGENEKGLTALEQYKDEANILRLAYEATDALIEQMDCEAFDFWTTSRKYRQRSGLLVRNKETFDEFYLIGSHRLFLTLLPIIREVQAASVAPIIHDATTGGRRESDGRALRHGRPRDCIAYHEEGGRALAGRSFTGGHSAGKPIGTGKAEAARGKGGSQRSGGIAGRGRGPTPSAARRYDGRNPRRGRARRLLYTWPNRSLQRHDVLMKKIVFRGKELEAPQCIDELTPEQYIYYIYLGSWLTGGNIDLEFWRVRWFSFLAGMGSSNYTILRPEFIAEAERLRDSITDPFLVDTSRGKAPTFKTCRNLLPEYRGYKGPADWLNDVKFGDFVQCIILMEQEPTAAAPEEIYRTIARVLYAIPEAEPVPDVLAWHASVLFGAVWKAIQSGPVDINGKMVDFSIIFKSSGSRRPDDKTGWAGISFEIAAAGVFGNVSELDAAPFWAVLMYLYKCKFEYMHDKSNKK